LKKLNKFIKDSLYVSKVTKTSNKKLLILCAVGLSQLSAVADISIILFFTYIITDNISANETLLPIFEFLFSKPILLPIFIVLRFSFNYFQIMIIKNLELNVQKNLKVHLLSEVFNKRNYSVADAYFYINTLTTHISFFYSSFASFLNYFLQIFAFSVYLFFSNSDIMTTFIVGVAILFYPIVFLLRKARKYMHDSYVFGQDSNVEIQRVVDNMFLIKLLKKEKEEVDRFSKTLNKFNKSLFNNHKYGVINSYLPSFLTLFILSLLTVFSNLSKTITLDIIGISLRLFQSVGNLTTAINQIINSHVHLEKFYELEFSKAELNKSNFVALNEKTSKEIIKFEDVSFKYVNSENLIFDNLNLQIKRNTHTLITGQNGSGKSTLLGLMAGVFYPVGGKITNSTDKIGFVGASPLIFTSTLRENILYGNKENINDEEIYDQLNKFKTFNEKGSYDLDRVIDNKSLSSGQTQKIAFIRALLMDIDILLLDESTANLDDVSKDLIFEILKKNEITIVNSTHDFEKFETSDHHINIRVSDESRSLEFYK
tara:strand:+ start:1938 stop:3563 length:1626 start_codon:yes stop_codon:yes gene_type:complete